MTERYIPDFEDEAAFDAYIDQRIELKQEQERPVVAIDDEFVKNFHKERARVVKEQIEQEERDKAPKEDKPVKKGKK